MKKFKLTWDERVTDHEGDFLYMQEKSQIIEAENEDAACGQWEQENEHNEYQNGLSDCVEVIDHPLFAKRLYIDMPDASKYAVPIEFIARHRAEYYAKNYEGDVVKSLLNDTLPLFESYEDEIHDWSSNNMNWSDVQDVAVLVKNPDIDYDDGWCNGEWKVA